MGELFWLTDAQMERQRPFFQSHAASPGSMTGGC